MKRGFFFSIAAFALLIMTPGIAQAPVNDGFVAAKVIAARHFTIQLAPAVDELSLISTLDIGPGHKILAGQNLPGGAYAPDRLGDLVDALFSWVSGVLDMQLSGYKGTVKVVADGAAMKDVFRRLYGRESYSDKGFYVFDNNTLYIAAGDFTKEIMGHEMAHAVISNFFVVQPPEKVQEVLAGYIEYQIRKGNPSRP